MKVDALEHKNNTARARIRKWQTKVSVDKEIWENDYSFKIQHLSTKFLIILRLYVDQPVAKYHKMIIIII